MRRETIRIPYVKPCVSFTHSMRIPCVSLTHGMRYIRDGMRYIRDGMDAGNCQDSHSADIECSRERFPRNNLLGTVCSWERFPLWCQK
jgi:hypothetical protein